MEKTLKYSYIDKLNLKKDIRYLSKNEIPKPMGSRHPSIAPFEAFKTNDSYIIIAAGNDKLFENLCIALEVKDLINDKKFNNNSSRSENMDELKKKLSKNLEESQAMIDNLILNLNEKSHRRNLGQKSLWIHQVK